MKIIGLDVGTKRIGVARADTGVKIAVPQCTVTVDGTEFEQIARLARVYNTKFFVVGLPRNSKGEETAQSEYSRNFAKKLKVAVNGAKIAFQDESLTSVEAENQLKERKKSYTKGEIDAEAATIILQDFLENFHSGAAKTESFATTGVMPKIARKKKLTKSMKKLIFCLVGFFVLVVSGLTIFYVDSLGAVSGSTDCSTDEAISNNLEVCQYKILTIEDGASVQSIASSLKNKDIIKNELVFKIYLKLHGYGSSLKAGRYSVNKLMSVQEIAEMLSDGSAGVVTFRITAIPGETLADFKKTLLMNGYSEEEINEAFSKEYDHKVLSSKPKDASLEGYIFGETIEYNKGASVETIITGFLDELYKTVVAYNLEEKFAGKGLSLHEGITLASIIQKEANSSEEMPNVSSVFYNRLNIGQHLGSDATIKYYINQIDPERKKYKDNATILSLDSCYNTSEAYGNAGLPCGPISNPGISALKSVASPSDTPYLYFLTGDDGMMYYSSTAEGHEANRAMHCQVYCDASL